MRMVELRGIDNGELVVREYRVIEVRWRSGVALDTLENIPCSALGISAVVVAVAVVAVAAVGVVVGAGICAVSVSLDGLPLGKGDDVVGEMICPDVVVDVDLDVDVYVYVE